MQKIVQKKKNVGDLIFIQRLVLGLTMRDLGKKVNRHPSTVYSWEKGYSSPSPKSIRDLSKVFEINVDHFVEARS